MVLITAGLGLLLGGICELIRLAAVDLLHLIEICGDSVARPGLGPVDGQAAPRTRPPLLIADNGGAAIILRPTVAAGALPELEHNAFGAGIVRPFAAAAGIAKPRLVSRDGDRIRLMPVHESIAMVAIRRNWNGGQPAFGHNVGQRGDSVVPIGYAAGPICRVKLLTVSERNILRDDITAALRDVKHGDAGVPEVKIIRRAAGHGETGGIAGRAVIHLGHGHIHSRGAQAVGIVRVVPELIDMQPVLISAEGVGDVGDAAVRHDACSDIGRGEHAFAVLAGLRGIVYVLEYEGGLNGPVGILPAGCVHILGKLLREAEIMVIRHGADKLVDRPCLGHLRLCTLCTREGLPLRTVEILHAEGDAVGQLAESLEVFKLGALCELLPVFIHPVLVDGKRHGGKRIRNAGLARAAVIQTVDARIKRGFIAGIALFDIVFIRRAVGVVHDEIASEGARPHAADAAVVIPAHRIS